MISSTRRDFILNVLKGSLALSVMPLPSFGRGTPIRTHALTRYFIISQAGNLMNDGELVPKKPDGMTCLKWGEDYLLLRNHEVGDAGGGVTSILLDKDLNVKNEEWKLKGTSRNCNGGTTPWNTWLSCEETFEEGSRRHGYVYEVDPNASVEENSTPLVEMGRFNHEACGYHQPSGYIYMTEDRSDSCFYRFLPHNPRDLKQEGVLEALVIGDTSLNTSNFEEGRKVHCTWVELLNPDPVTDILRAEAQKLGAAVFVRGEGITVSGDDIIFTCTTGGANELGQIFSYNAATGVLEVLYQPSSASFLRKPDNLGFNHLGDLLVCEDGDGANRIVGITPEKKVYVVAEALNGEWAGVCMSPDNKYLFANLLDSGQTYAFEVPWHHLRSSKR